MAADYYECVAWKETRNGKKFAVRLGSAKKRDDGGFWVNLDAIPAPTEGQYSFVIQPQRECGTATTATTARGNADTFDRGTLDSDIPF